MAKLVEAVYFDSCVWINALENAGIEADQCRNCIQCAEQSSLIVVMSTIIPLEVLGHNLEDLTDSCGLRRAKPHSVDPKVIAQASRIRSIFFNKRKADTSTPKVTPKALDLGDAIHLATAAIENCRCMVTCDGHFDKHIEFARGEYNLEILKPDKFLERYAFQPSLMQE